MAGISVCIQTDPEGPIRKITKLIPMSDGGFSVLVPYHSGHEGVVSKNAPARAQVAGLTA